MSYELNVFLVDGCDVILFSHVFFRSWLVLLQGSCTPAGAGTTRFDSHIKTVMTEYVSHYHRGGLLQYHEAVLCVWVDQVVTDMRLWLRNAISTLTENALQLISTLVERAAAWDRHTLMQANTHIYSSLNLFLKLPFGVFCHLLLSQRNWCPVSWLHPHAESSANQVEPLDSKVTEDSTANLPLFIH